MSAIKWITGGLGWVMGGPIGAILGVGAGYLIEEMTKPGTATGHQQRSTTTGGGPYSATTRNDFTLSFVVLVAAVMKADGKILRSELDFVKEHFVKMFGINGAREATRLLGDIIKQNIPITDVSRQIKANMDYSSRVQLLHLLFGIAAADKEVTDSEVDTIYRIAASMGISQADWNAIKAMFVSDRHWAYKVLELEPDASAEEIKKAYRKMAIKFHPDKVAHLGDEYQQQAKEKFQKVNQAYEELKKIRNLN